MSNHTTFKIGGAADFVVLPENESQLLCLMEQLRGTPYFVIGNGSNLLVSDSGIRGVVIKINSNMSQITQQGNMLICQSGALLSKVASFALECGLGGFEFAAGIPGTIGGATVMNAGAYGGKMQDVVIKTKYIDESGCLNEITEHKFGHRQSIFSRINAVIIQSTILLHKKNKAEIKAEMADLAARRRRSQPLEYCSAGSVFKRPPGNFAGKLIEEAGLKGYRRGGAVISGKHCGFIINESNATFNDVVCLIKHIQSEVYKKFGVQLETEVKICGL